MFDNEDETMYEEGLNEYVANATVKAVYSFVDEIGEDTIQADFWKYLSE